MRLSRIFYGHNYSFSGASNVGQLANEVAIELARAGKRSICCLVGLAVHVSTMVQNAKAADQFLVIDGCGVKCGRNALNKSFFPTSTAWSLRRWG